MKSTFLKCLLLAFAVILLTQATNSLLNIKGLLYNSLAEKLTHKEIKQFFTLQEKWRWATYVFISLLLFIKSVLIASVLYIGVYFFSQATVTFKELWAVVMQAEFVFLLVPVIKLGWFYFFKSQYTFEDIQYFYPLSALNIIGYKGLTAWFLYPLQVLNVFELIYMLYLGYQIGHLTRTNADRGLKIVACSYLPALLLWVVVIMFFTLNFL